MDFSQYVLVGTNMVHHCIAEFLTCPVYLKIFKILFRDHFFDMPNRQRVKARKTWFWFWYDHIRSGCPPSKGESAVKTIIS